MESAVLNDECFFSVKKHHEPKVDS